MADDLDFDQFIPKGEGADLDFDQFIPSAAPETAQPTAEAPPEPLKTAPSLDELKKNLPPGISENIPSLVKGAEWLYNLPGMKISRSISDWLGENVGAYTTEPLAKGAARSFAGGVGSGARGVQVLGMATDNEVPEAVKEFGTTLNEYAKDKSLEAEVPDIKDINGVGDASKYLFNQFGNVLGGVGSLLGIDIGVTAGVTAAAGPVAGGAAGLTTLFGVSTLQSIGSTFDTIMEDEGVKKRIKSGELSEEDVARLSIPVGAVNGAITTAMVKAAGKPGSFTNGFAKDIASRLAKDPALFAGGSLSQGAINEIASAYAGGDVKLQERFQHVLNEAVNSAVGGLLFGGAKAGGRVSTRMEAKDRLKNQEAIREQKSGVEELAPESAGQDIDTVLKGRVDDLFAASEPPAEPPSAPPAETPPAAKGKISVKEDPTDPTLRAALDDLKSQDEPIQAGIDALQPKGEPQAPMQTVEVYKSEPAPSEPTAAEPAAEPTKAAEPSPEPKEPIAADPKEGSATETRATLDAQVKDLKDGFRKAVLLPDRFNNDRPELPDGMSTARLPNKKVVYYDPQQIKWEDILALYKSDRLNEALNMADTSKVDAMERSARSGEDPSAITVRDENGTPKVDALTTSETVTPDVQKIAEQARPTDTVEVRPVAEVTAERAQGQEPPALSKAEKVKQVSKQRGKKVKMLDEDALPPEARSEAPPPAPPAEPAPAAPVTREVTPPEAKRVLEVAKSKEQEAADKKAETNIKKGGRGLQEDVPPDAKNRGAREAFERRAKKAYAAGLETGKAPEMFYVDAAEAMKDRQKGGDPAKNEAVTAKVMDAWRAEWDHVQNGGTRFGVKNKTVGKVQKEIDKQAKQAAKEETKAAKGPTTRRVKISDEQAAEITKKHGLTEKEHTPEEQREIAALIKQQKSDELYGDSVKTSGFEVKENLQAGANASVAEMLPSQQARSSTMGVRTGKTPEEIKAAEEGKVKAGEVRTVERTPEALAEAQRSLERLMAKIDNSDVRRSIVGNEKASVDVMAELVDALNGMTPKETKALADRINKMTDHEWENWLLKADRPEYIDALAAAAVHDVARFDPANFKKTAEKIENSVTFKSTTTLKELFAENNVSLSNEGLIGLLQSKLVKLVGDMKVHTVDAENMQRALFGLGRRKDAQGLYHARDNHILVNEEHFFSGTKEARELLLHEGLHGAISNALERMPALKKQIDALLGHAKEIYEKSPELQGKYDRDRISYAFKDAHEFLSETFSNKHVQELFGDIHVDKATLEKLGVETNAPVRNVFQTVIEKIREVLKGPPNSRSVIEQIVRFTDEALVAREARGDGAKYSAKTTMEMLKATTAAKNRNIDPKYWLSRVKPTNPETAARAHLISKGVDPVEAGKVAEMIVQRMGPNPNRAQLINKLNQYAAAHGGKAGSPKAAAATQSQTPPVTQKSNSASQKSGVTAKRPKPQRDLTEEPSYGSKMREALVDSNEYLARQMRAAEARLGAPVSDEQNIYELRRVLGPKIVNALRKVENTTRRDLLSTMAEGKKLGLSGEDVGDLVYARAAARRNERMQADDQTLRSGSGMTDKEAADLLDNAVRDPKTGKVDPARQAFVDKVFELNDRIRREIHDIKIESGELSKEQSDKLYAMEPHYTSLKGFADEFTPDQQTSSGGPEASLRSNGLGKAEGRETKANNPLENMLQELARAHRSALVNETNKNLAQFVKDTGANSIAVHKDPNYASDRAKEDGRLVFFFEDGKKRALEFEDKLLAEKWKRMSPEQRNAFHRGATKLVNGVKSLWTNYSPQFLARHFLFRYPIEALVNMMALKEKGVQVRPASYVKEIFTSVPDVYRFLRGNEVKDKTLQKWLNEAADAGGIVSYRGMTDAFDLDAQMKRMGIEGKSGVMDKLKKVHEAVNTFHTSMDLAERLQVYIRAREAGMTEQKAAIAMRDATVDFDMKGDLAPNLNLWLPFSNVALLTTDRIIQNTKTSRSYRKTVLGIMGASLANGIANYMLGGEDDDGTPHIEKVRGYDAGQNVMILTGEGENGKMQFAKVPLPYNLFGPWATGQAMAQAIMSHVGKSKMSEGDIALRFVEAWAETLSPIGRNLRNPSSLLSTSAATPILQTIVNQNAFGAPIYKEHAKGNAPRSEQGKDSTGEGYHWIAQQLAKVGLDTYPEVYKHLTEYVAGAQIRLGKGIYETATGKAENGEEHSANKTPMLSVVKGEVEADKLDRDRFYALYNKAEADADDTKALKAVVGGYANADQRELVAKKEKFTGMTAKQIIAVNDAKKQLNAIKNAEDDDTSPKAIAIRKKFFTTTLRKLNEMGVTGGIH